MAKEIRQCKLHKVNNRSKEAKMECFYCGGDRLKQCNALDKPETTFSKPVKVYQMSVVGMFSALQLGVRELEKKCFNECKPLVNCKECRVYERVELAVKTVHDAKMLHFNYKTLKQDTE